jgi:hypothetical protein
MGVQWIDPTPQLRAEEARQARMRNEPTTRLKQSVYTSSAPVIEYRSSK